MITHRDLEGFPTAAAPGDRASSIVALNEGDALELIAGELTQRSLDRILRVVLHLHAQASVAGPDVAAVLLAEADELDSAVRAARDVLFPRDRPPVPATGPPPTPIPPPGRSCVEATVCAGGPSIATDQSPAGPINPAR